MIRRTVCERIVECVQFDICMTVDVCRFHVHVAICVGGGRVEPAVGGSVWRRSVGDKHVLNDALWRLCHLDVLGDICVCWGWWWCGSGWLGGDRGCLGEKEGEEEEEGIRTCIRGRDGHGSGRV